MSDKGYALVPKPSSKRDSVSSDELNNFVSNAALDSIEFTKPTIPSAASDIKPSAPSPTTIKPAKDVPEYINNLILASKALTNIGIDKAAYKLRRIILSTGKFDGKLAFARHFGDIGLPYEISGTKRAPRNTDYAFERIQAATSELKKRDEVDMVREIETLWAALRLSPKVTSEEGEEWTQV